MALSLQTLDLTTTIWTQTTTFVEGGKAQMPVVTIYSSFQPIEWASYPDPIMSATGADLSSLLSERHSQSLLTAPGAAIPTTMVTVAVTPNQEVTATSVPPSVNVKTTTIASDEANVTPVDSTSLENTAPTAPQLDSSKTIDQAATPSIQSIIVSTFVAEWTTTLLITVCPTDGYQPSSVNAIEATGSMVPSSPHTGTVSNLERDEIPRTPIEIDASNAWCLVPFPQVFAWFDSFGRFKFVLLITALFLLLLLVYLILKRRYGWIHANELPYTSKPPRPGLQKRLSLSVPGRRSSNPSEALHVSGHGASIGRSEARKIQISPHIEV